MNENNNFKQQKEQKEQEQEQQEDIIITNKVIFALVGLPARGKSYLSAKIVSYFNWLGISSKIFNAGRKRRNKEGAISSGRANFFEKNNNIALSKRDQIALETLNDAINWLLNEEGKIAVFDATNTTKERRKLIQEHLNHINYPFQLVFIESICNNEEVLQNNLLQKVLHSPDFSGMNVEDALNDLKARIKAYEEVYETVDDNEGFSYVKVIDLANKMICYQIWGSIPLRTVQLLMSCHIGTRPVYLVRSGQCNDIDDLAVIDPILSSLALTTSIIDNSNSPYDDFNINTTESQQQQQQSQKQQQFQFQQPDRIRSLSNLPNFKQIRMPSALTCNSLLNDDGKEFSRQLGEFITQELNLQPITDNNNNNNNNNNNTLSSNIISPKSYYHHNHPLHFNVPKIRVITSTLPRAVETAAFLPCPTYLIQQRSALGILDTGIYHGMTVESIKSKYPEEYQKWKENPFIYRFAGGESLLDMNRRLADIVLEIERHHEPVVVISHLSPIQSLIAYFVNRDPKEIPLISVPQHSVVKLVPSIYGWSMEIISLKEKFQHITTTSITQPLTSTSSPSTSPKEN